MNGYATAAVCAATIGKFDFIQSRILKPRIQEAMESAMPAHCVPDILRAVAACEPPVMCICRAKKPLTPTFKPTAREAV